MSPGEARERADACERDVPMPVRAAASGTSGPPGPTGPPGRPEPAAPVGGTQGGAPEAARVAVVRFRTPGQAREYANGRFELEPGALVVVETERGTRIGTAVELIERPGPPPALRVLRVVTDDDLEVHSRNKVREREAFAFCNERIRALGLAMKLVGVEILHSGSSAVFSFTSADRVDFRVLVKDLARRFHTHIDMRQIGVRDAARLCGGVAVCGRDLCCATWLPVFAPISVRMAKDQNLALNQEKLSGLCGRLRCCLAFEEAAYFELRKGLPKVGKRVLTPAGEGRVKDVDVIKRLVRVQLVDGRYQEFHGADVRRPVDPGAPAREHEGAGDASAHLGPSVPPASRSPACSPERAAPTPSPAREGAALAGAADEASTRRRRRRRRRRGGGDGTPGGANRPPPSGAPPRDRG